MPGRPIHEFAPVTKCGAWRLSRAYGYSGLRSLLRSIPEGATVADFGAGNSNFGLRVAEKRPDIRMINADLRFNRAETSQWQVLSGPDNLHHVRCDVLNPSFQPRSIDRIFSSAMLPHLIMTSRETGETAVHALASLLKPDGKMELARFPNLPLAYVIEISAADYAQNTNEAVTEAIDFLSIPPWRETTQRIINMATNPDYFRDLGNK